MSGKTAGNLRPAGCIPLDLSGQSLTRAAKQSIVIDIFAFDVVAIQEQGFKAWPFTAPKTPANPS
jgi:hypothetical protein